MTQLIKECMLSILHGDSSFGIGFPLARVLFFLVWNCCKKHVPRVYTEKSGFSSTSVPERSPFCQNRLGHARSQRLIPVRQATIPWRMLNTLLTSLLCKCPGWPGKDFWSYSFQGLLNMHVLKWQQKFLELLYSLRVLREGTFRISFPSSMHSALTESLKNWLKQNS